MQQPTELEGLECRCCDQDLSNWGYLFEGEHYCSPMCVGIKLLEDGEIEKIK